VRTRLSSPAAEETGRNSRTATYFNHAAQQVSAVSDAMVCQPHRSKQSRKHLLQLLLTSKVASALSFCCHKLQHAQSLRLLSRCCISRRSLECAVGDSPSCVNLLRSTTVSARKSSYLSS
jgi:hypothetical protein